MTTFAILSLGCKVNSYESQWYSTVLKEKGLEEVDFHDAADIYIINTCDVTNVAGAKSRQKINTAKKNNPNSYICVVGCYAQLHPNDIDCDLLIGTTSKSKLPQLVIEGYQQHLKVVSVENDFCEDEVAYMPINDFRNTRAYLKIQDGCNQFCSYCAIPYARGKERSLAVEKVVETAQNLVNNQHYELVLTGIHTGRYNYNGIDLAQLIQILLKEVKGLLRLRISSIEITEITDQLIELIANEDVIAKHLHIPLQSGSNKILKLMNRPYTVEQFSERVNFIRQKVPSISISTDIIEGFPSENNQDFSDEVASVKKIAFSFMHVFPFSPKKGTKACQMNEQVEGKVKKERVAKMLTLSKELYHIYQDEKKNVEVLIETHDENSSFGHSSEYIPVKVLNQKLPIGSIIKVQVVKRENEMLLGEVICD